MSGPMREALEVALHEMRRWHDADECDCGGEGGHVCGLPRLERSIDQARAALEADTVEVPRELAERIRGWMLKLQPSVLWGVQCSGHRDVREQLKALLDATEPDACESCGALDADTCERGPGCRVGT